MIIIDWLVEKLLLGFCSYFLRSCLNYLKKRNKLVSVGDGELQVNTVNHQGTTIDLLSANSQNTRIAELPKILNSPLKQSIDPIYLLENTNFRGYDKCIFRVNGCRFSTFFVFSDGSRVVFHNRSLSNPDLQIVKNDRYDMFGAVSFENSTIVEKISNSNGFFDVKPLHIELIPGFAFEDTNESYKDSIFFPKITVVMIGFHIKLNPEDLDKATSINGKSKIEIYPIKNSPNQTVLTSKSKIAMNFLMKNL